MTTEMKTIKAFAKYFGAQKFFPKCTDLRFFLMREIEGLHQKLAIVSTCSGYHAVQFSLPINYPDKGYDTEVGAIGSVLNNAKVDLRLRTTCHPRIDSKDIAFSTPYVNITKANLIDILKLEDHYAQKMAVPYHKERWLK